MGSRRPSPGREARLQELLDRERLKDEISKGLQVRHCIAALRYHEFEINQRTGYRTFGRRDKHRAR